MNDQFFPLMINDIKQETADCVSITFDVPAAQKTQFEYTQGQYLTIKASINGEEVRRAYSLSSAPHENKWTVTVKRVENGKMTTYLTQNIKVGDTLDVMPPAGRFFTKLNPESKKTYYLFGAGSGITPLISIVKSTLEKEPQSTIFLLYGNRNEEQIILKNDLDALQKRYEGQLFVEYILSQPKKVKSSGVMGMFGKSTMSWQGKVGRIDTKNTLLFLEENPNRSPKVEYFICGPGEMIKAVESVLHGQGIENRNIHQEYFTVVAGDEKSESTLSGDAQVKVNLNGKIHEISMKKSETILKALVDAGIQAPYSCTTGACSTCMAKTMSGSVTMDVCYALDEDEVKDGYILTCQAHPTTDSVEINFDA